MKKKKYNKIIIIIAVFFGLMLFGLIENTITGNLVKDKKIVIYFPEIGDFPNTEEGTVVFSFNFPNADFKVGDKTADILMFLDSKNIAGLKIGYDTKERKIYAGMPLLSSEVSILDGNLHELAYIFNRKEKKQAIFLDGNLLREGEFTGEIELDILTGYAVHEKGEWIESPIRIDVAFK